MILLTGASGFVGGALAEHLLRDRGERSFVAYTSRPLPGYNCVLHENHAAHPSVIVDAGFEEVDTVIHCGAFTPKNAQQANRVGESNGNIRSTEHLLGLHLPNLRRFVYLSSIDVYGGSGRLSETSPTSPRTLYGWSKLYCEKLVAVWCLQRRVDVTVLRVGHVYGPGEEAYEKMIPTAIRRAIVGEPLRIYGEGRERRSFIFIDDVVRAIVASVEVEQAPELVNLVGATEVAMSEVADAIVRISGSRSTVERLPVSTEASDLVFETERMSRLYEGQISFEDGLRSEIEHMKRVLA